MTAKEYIYSQHVGDISYSEPELFDCKKQTYLGLYGKREKISLYGISSIDRYYKDTSTSYHI